ncbi:MAG: DUF2034 domain-containing protein [Proteobacteria bacterium]|nr:DUF2034 domain-containing protein [Pseudomonadota bacterium]
MDKNFNVKHTGNSLHGDGGIDLWLKEDDKTIIIQCKAYKNYVNAGVVRELYGTLIHEKADEAWLVVTSGFSRGVEDFARNKQIRLLTIRDLIKLPPVREKETRRDERFIAYNNGTVLDTRTNLMWAVKDNGKDIKWVDAKKYCENYHGGGYADWRMPTLDELAGLYDSGKTQPVFNSNSTRNIHMATELIHITTKYGCWASETRGAYAAYFSFRWGNRCEDSQSGYDADRVLPVRSRK